MAREIRVAVAGAHLDGQPLNHELTDRGARMLARTTTAACYRLYALDTQPAKPGLVRGSGERDAAAIEVEVWALEASAFAEFVDALVAPMVIGRVLLADGSDVAGFLCEAFAVAGARDITAFGGWRAYCAARGEPKDRGPTHATREPRA